MEKVVAATFFFLLISKRSEDMDIVFAIVPLLIRILNFARIAVHYLEEWGRCEMEVAFSRIEYAFLYMLCFS
jgi:hypothetical protein